MAVSTERNVESDDFKELLIRWFQFGTFCPVMRLHGLRMPGEKIFDRHGVEREWTGADNEVWSYGEEAYEIFVKYIGIREQMRDYTRRLMKEAHEEGTPVMRTLFYEFPEDTACWNIYDEYMYGDKLLVAPVCHEHAMARQVYLPASTTWQEAATGKEYAGRKGVRCGGTVRPDSCFYKKIKPRRKAGRLECIHLQRIAGWASRKLIRSMRNCFA